MSAAPMLPVEVSEPAAVFELAEPAGVFAETGQRPEVRRFVAVLARLVASAEPAVVFTSLAGLCVPDFSDECCILLVEDPQPGYLICSPGPAPSTHAASVVQEWAANADQEEQQVTARTLRTTIMAPAEFGDPGYRGVLVHRWQCHQPTDIDTALAQLMLDRAVASVRQERLINRLQQLHSQVENLNQGLISNREIGAAIGILMATQQITNTQAFDQLRATSQLRHLKLRDIAAEVMFTGALEQPRPNRCNART